MYFATFNDRRLTEVESQTREGSVSHLTVLKLSKQLLNAAFNFLMLHSGGGGGVLCVLYMLLCQFCGLLAWSQYCCNALSNDVYICHSQGSNVTYVRVSSN